MSDLAQKKCVACEGFQEPLNETEAKVLMAQIPNWQLASDAKSIARSFDFKNFSDALAFTNKVGAIAESEGHHPDISLGWGKVHIELTTHAIKGLSENDFIVAAKVDQIV
ncbi:MAG: hypothetical protein RIQ56_125 [Candidatus Parcubacteria bacterium]|jgi:4a-hydroxytetrahydrobiopterin dehydratase